MTPEEKWDRRLRLHYEKGTEALREASRLHRQLKAIEGGGALAVSGNYDKYQKEFARVATLAELHFLALKVLKGNDFKGEGDGEVG